MCALQKNVGFNLFQGPMKRALITILPWIEENHSVLIRGSEGCGKISLINMALSKMKIKAGELSTVIQGSSLYGPQDLINRIKRACIKLESSSNGRTYKPRSGTRLILILEDIHLASKELQVNYCLFLTKVQTASIELNLMCVGVDSRTYTRR